MSSRHSNSSELSKISLQRSCSEITESESLMKKAKLCSTFTNDSTSSNNNDKEAKLSSSLKNNSANSNDDKKAKLLSSVTNDLPGSINHCDK